jgi:ATP-dependent Lhr-like helicase
VLAAADPANAYGAALPWPEPASGHKTCRKAGALVVLVGGDLALYLERGGKTLLAWPAMETVLGDDPRLTAATAALAEAVRAGRTGTLHIERVNDAYAPGSTLGPALEAAGFHATPQGFRLRP